MLLLQTDVLGAGGGGGGVINEISSKQCVWPGVNKLNCFKATQVLGGPTKILIWAFKIGKSPTR